MALALTEENYYSQEANEEYMSVSQYKDFAGTNGKLACEASALAKIRGEYADDPSTALLVGSYIDRYFEGTLHQFTQEHPEIFRGDGELKASYRQAVDIIARLEEDELFMTYMSGQKQVIMTGELFGAKWKIKMDSYHPGVGIVDLKVMESLTKSKWVRDYGNMDFVRYWGYDIQGAVYQEIVRQNTGKKLPFYIAGASKEKTTNLEIIHVSDVYLKEALKGVEANMPHVLAVKASREKPMRCGLCDYCKQTKKLTRPIELSELLDEA